MAHTHPMACPRPAEAPGWLPAANAAGWAAAQTGLGLLHLPLDILRDQHACAARAGLVSRSMLASRDFEGLLGAIEAWSLGPLARRV